VDAFSLETANPSEQADTPDEVFKMIFTHAYTTSNEWHDPCPLKPDFCSTTNACAQVEDRIWSYLTFVNPPFDKTVLFIRKTHEQWREHRYSIA